jgi:NAD(P)H-hydrate epimerase
LQRPLKERQIEISEISEGNFAAEVESGLAWCTAAVDGLFGTGLKRDLEGPLAEIVRLMNSSGRPVVAVDIPSGVDSDTGAIRGAAIDARFTAALGALKYGHVIPPGSERAGKIELGDIGLSDVGRGIGSGELLTEDLVREMLPARPQGANKGTFGKAMIVAGSVNYIGAAALATEGALRSGAGLVTLGCAGDLLPILAVKLTESTFLPLPSDLGVIASQAASTLLPALKGYTALLVGCGIGKEKETANFLRGLLAQAAAPVHAAERPIGFALLARSGEQAQEDEHTALPPLVLDGDALNLLSEADKWWETLPANCVLTPHPGEMARLSATTVEEVQKDRVKSARDAAAKWKQIVVLKGAATVIADPTGKIFVSPFSNPALATAGTGDVLAGCITGMLAQGLSPVNAACVGVFLHGMAGEMLRNEFGAAGGLAGDLPPLLARAQKTLRETKGAAGR